MVILRDPYNNDLIVRIKKYWKGVLKIGVKKKEFDGWQIDRPLNVEIAGKVVEIKQTARAVKRPDLQWLDADRYVDLTTGEIKFAEHSETRGDKMSRSQLRKSFAKMRGLINSNFSGQENESLITLTYHENMTDPQRLYYDMDKFCKRLKTRLGALKYVTAVEPQGRGAWHAHMLCKQLEGGGLVDKQLINGIWPHGYIIDVEPLDHVDNVGAYLTAYLSNVPTEDGANGAAVGKAVKKGGRLNMYPRGMHVFRASRNCEKPKQIKMRPMSPQHRALTLASASRYNAKFDIYAEDLQTNQQYLLNSLAHEQRYVNNSDVLAMIIDNDRTAIQQYLDGGASDHDGL